MLLPLPPLLLVARPSEPGRLPLPLLLPPSREEPLARGESASSDWAARSRRQFGGTRGG